ncbi:MAG: hypothetical protein PH343_06995 [Nitrospira sp.]|nr:hypothetical protein [Nitrospira sp.]
MSRKRTAYSLLFIGIWLFCFTSEKAIAGSMSQGSKMLRMPKYSLSGGITLQYEDNTSSGSGQTTHTNRFTQNYRLNFQSYITSPKIMYYTLTTGFDVVTGTGVGKGTTKSYGAETVFFPTQPLTFSLRASMTDNDDYRIITYGLSANYSRPSTNKARNIRSMRDIPKNNNSNVNLNENNNVNYNSNSNSNANANANINANINANANSNSNSNSNSNENVKVRKPKAKDKAKFLESGLFSDILPTLMFLNIDRTDFKTKTSESIWNNASLRFKGFAPSPRTVYFLNFNYNNWTRGDGIQHKGYGGDLTTSTQLRWSFFQQFENNFSYRKNGVTAYNLTSSLLGQRKNWNYHVTLSYVADAGIDKTNQLNLDVGLSKDSRTQFVYKGIEFDYAFGFGVNRGRGKTDLWASTVLNAYKRFGSNTEARSSLSVIGGKLGSAIDFRTGVVYTFRPRKGYTVRVELDPEKKIIKSNTFKPQIYGWDYSIRTGYTFGASKTTGSRAGSNWGSVPFVTSGAGSGQKTNQTVMSHRGDLNINIWWRSLTIASDAVLFYADGSKSFSWNNSVYTTVMRKVGVTIGTGLTMDMPKGSSTATTYTVYNLISYSPWRNALLRIDTRYSKIMPSNVTTLDLSPSLGWAWRKLFMDLTVTLRKVKGGSGQTQDERRIMMRVTRPFKIL